jgi:spermidine synthase
LTARLLCALFFLSGVSALIFEVVWFREAGLVFGNSIWASTLVLSSFMGGLAVGNGLVARLGDRLRRPILAYAGLEVAIAVTGAGIVWLLPLLPGALAPLFGALLDQPLILNPLRLLISFSLLLIPATAMGATLPVLVKALSARDPRFGDVLGRLYGWNTLGAVTGAITAEVVLIGPLGLLGTGLAAGSLNLVAGIAAVVVAGREGGPAPEPSAPKATATGERGRRLLAAAFLSGAILLALEVVWFRFLMLFVTGTSLAFAVLLAVVLAGIGVGGLVGARWVREDPEADLWLPQLAVASALLTLGLYAGFDLIVARVVALFFEVNKSQISDPLTLIGIASALMLPTSALSGVLFTLIGQAGSRVLGAEARTAGLLTLSNTLGGMLGSAAGGFVLLPWLGVEKSILVLSLAYLTVAGASATRGALSWGASARRRTGALVGVGLSLCVLLLTFPHGKMDRVYVRLPMNAYLEEGMEVVAVREGLTETSAYLRSRLWGEPRSHRLMTNGHSMASNRWPARRYMKLYVYWPIALAPDARDALLISFGAGSTASAMADSAGLERIDIVDISRDVIEMAEFVYEPEANPLNDPRVKVHIEDGRFFLLTTPRRYDLITAEPPPPTFAGIVNLYTREYFQLMHDRLKDHGMATYWLPLHSLTDDDARSIVSAFCAVFEDCSLWNAMNLDWMLAGSRGGLRPASEREFRRQWEDPAVAPELARLGFERPEQIGALFLADAAILREAVRDTPPLDDDHPHRLSHHDLGLYDRGRSFEFMRAFQDPALARQRFEKSALIRRVWPPGLRNRSLQYFAWQDLLNRALIQGGSAAPIEEEEIRRLLEETELRSLVQWALRSDPEVEAVAAKVTSRSAGDIPMAEIHLGIGALADRDYPRAERHFARATQLGAAALPTLRLRILALCLDGKVDRAAALARSGVAGRDPSPEEREYWERMERTFALPNPLG